MDNSEKMLLESIQSDMRRMRDDTNNINKNILYLCGHAKSTNSRLEGIEKLVCKNDDRLFICENKITTIRSWAIAIGSIIILIIPIIAATI